MKMYLRMFTALVSIALGMFWHVECVGQERMDLAKVNFSEDIKAITKGIPNLHEAKLSGREAMVSYGFDNDGTFVYSGILPGHIELLSWNGKLVGYAFKIKSFADQQKVESWYKERFRDATLQNSKFMNVYHFQNDKVSAELRTVIEEKFKDGANGYLDIKNTAFVRELEKTANKLK